MRAKAALCLLAGSLVSPAAAAGAQWQAVEKVETYAVSGTTGIELYTSIGERGPKLSNGSRAIAHTNFKLTWSRKYEPDGAGGCTLAAARPNLTIIYTLPEPAQKLPTQVQRQWAAFIAGMREHEKLHGVFIKEMVEAIEAYSVGLKVADDPGCKKIRQVLTKRLGELSQAQRQRSRDFDRAEMGEAGPIRRLILALVNRA